MNKLSDSQAAYVERFTTFGITLGLPPSMARVLAFLQVCEPERQPAEDVKQVLGLSTGAVSNALLWLCRGGLAERTKVPGDRRYYYQLLTEGWRRTFERRVRLLGQARDVAQSGLEINPNNQRLIAMRDFFAWSEKECTGLLERLEHDLPARS